MYEILCEFEWPPTEPLNAGKAVKVWVGPKHLLFQFAHKFHADGFTPPPGSTATMRGYGPLKLFRSK